MKRLFLAIPIKTTDNDFVPLLDGLKRQLAHEKRINWVKPSHIHLTLKFIGDTHPDEIPKIIDEIGEMVKRHKSFTMDFNRTGIFGSRYAPRVLWLGMQNTPQELLDLEEDTLTSFDKLGFIRDRQNFVPHITLGRIKELCEKQYFQKIVSLKQVNKRDRYTCQMFNYWGGNDILIFTEIISAFADRMTRSFCR